MPHPEPVIPPDAPTTPGTTEVNLTEVDLEELLLPHIAPHTRAAQVGAVLAAVLVTVGLLLQSIGPLHQKTVALLPTSNPTSSLTSSPTPMPPTVVIASNVNFGTLTVNGQALKDPPPVVTRLVHEGMNVVTLAAPPFGQHMCRFWYSRYQLASIYPLSSDTACSGTSAVPGPFKVRGSSVVPDLLLDLELSGTDLPSDLAARAVGAAVQAVAAVPSQTVVPTGEYYATGHDAQGHISSRRATAPLRAQLRFTRGGCGPSPFCPIPLDPNLTFAPGQRIWSVGLLLTARWRFTPLGGPTVLSPPSVPLAAPLQLFLAADGAGVWSALGPATAALPLADQLTAALCQLGVDLLAGLLQAQGLHDASLSTSSNQGVDGCIIQLVQGSSTSTTPQGRFLWRFGVLLAVDTDAHRLVPWLPIAPPAEVAAVER